MDELQCQPVKELLRVAVYGWDGGRKNLAVEATEVEWPKLKFPFHIGR